MNAIEIDFEIGLAAIEYGESMENAIPYTEHDLIDAFKAGANKAIEILTTK